MVVYDLVDNAADAPQGLERGWVLQFDEEPTISRRTAGCVLPGALSGGPAQRVDVAALPFEADTLKLTFTLRVLGELATPSACNNPIK